MPSELPQYDHDPASETADFPQPLRDFSAPFVALMCDLSHLPAHEHNHQDRRLFALLITPAAAVPIADSPAFRLLDQALPSGIELRDLSPWHLGQLRLQAAFRLEGEETWTILPEDSVHLVPLPLDVEASLEPDVAVLTRWLDENLANAEPQSRGRHTRETIVRAATSIFPHNYALKCAACFAINGNALPPATQRFQLVARPLFAAHTTPNTGPVAQTAELVAWDCGALTGRQIRVAAYERAVAFAPATDAIANPLSRLELDRQLIRLRLPEGEPFEDVQGDSLEHLEERVGRWFDLPQRLLDGVAADGAPPLTPERLRGLIDWVISTSRDLAGSAWRATPGGGGLPLDVAHHLVDRDSGDFSPAARQLAQRIAERLRAREQDILRTTTDWLRFLCAIKSPAPREDGPLLPDYPTFLAPIGEDEQRITASFADLFANLLDPLEHEVNPSRSSTWTDPTWVLPALKRFIADLRNPANLRPLTIRQWRLAFRGWELQPPQSSEAILNGLGNVISRKPQPVRDHASGLLADSRTGLASWWDDIVHAQNQSTTAEHIARTVRTLLETSYAECRGLPNFGYFPRPQLPMPAVIWPTIAEIRAALFPELPLGAALQEVRVPHSIQLLVDQLASETKVEEPGDLLEQMAGILVFMRQAGRNHWRSLNLAHFELRRLSTGTRQRLRHLSLVPCRLGYLNGGRSAILTYNNRSLVARSEGDLIHERTAESVPDPNDAVIVDFESGTVFPELGDPGRAAARMPGLFYRRAYDLIAFPVLNAGILPANVAASAHPAVMRMPGDEGFDLHLPDVSTGSPYVARVQYRRRVGIGTPTVPETQSPNGNRPSLGPGFQPMRGVQPLARELLASDSEEAPLAVLFPANHARLPEYTSFSIQKAAADLENWDRWVASHPFAGHQPGSPEHTNLRVQTRTNVARSRENETSPVYLDDPALESVIYITAECVFAIEGNLRVPDPVLVRLPAGSEVRDNPLIFQARHSPSGIPMRVETGANTVDITIPEGSIWRVRIYSVIRENTLAAGFDDFPWTQPGANLPVRGHAGIVALSPLEYLFEAATARVPTWSELFAALRPSARDGQASLSLARPDRSFAMLSRLEVRVQLWRWTGRPMPPFPFEDATRVPDDGRQPDPGDGPDGAFVQEWELAALPHRPDSAGRSEPHRIAWIPAPNGASAPDVRLQTENHTADPRALLFRWGLKAWSRYEALRPDPVQSSTLKPGETWRRSVLLARPAARLTKPPLRFILPLGRRIKDARGESCLAAIAVFDGPWYKEAGLAERLEAQLLTTVHRPNAADPRTFLLAGHDPIISTRGLESIRTNAAPQLLPVGTPIGHSFEPDVDEPLIVATSFVLSLPPQLEAEGTALGRTSDWFLCAVRFRRALDARGVSAANEVAGQFASEWSASEWIQFMPDSLSLLRRAGWPAPDDDIAAEHAVPITQYPAQQWEIGGWAEPYEEPGSLIEPNRFEYWFILTREVTQLDGQPAEVYVMTIGLAEHARPITLDAAPDANSYIAAGSTLLLRVVELRTRNRNDVRTALRQGRPGSRQPWKLIFGETESFAPGAIRDDALAQITRISPHVRVRIQTPM